MAVPDFLIWRCAGCGAEAQGKKKPCACTTNVGVRKGPNGSSEQTWWDDPAPAETGWVIERDDCIAEGRRQMREEAAQLCDAESKSRHARSDNPLLGDEMLAAFPQHMVQASKGITAYHLAAAIRALPDHPETKEEKVNG